MIDILTVEGDLLSRVEVFDEADLDAALARFDELQPRAPRLENAASQVEQRFSTCFAARDWDAMAELLSDNILTDDRRHIVNAGVMRGRDAEIASERATADVGVTNMTPTMIAIRGGRLALGCYSIFDGWSGTKVLCVSEINAKNQIMARVAFDPEDIDAAFAELDARFLAGEAAAHAQTWSAMTRVQAAYNQHEVPPTTADCVNIDHRRGRAFAPGDVLPYIRATYDVAPNVKGHLEAVHRLGSPGVVVTETVSGTSQDGFAFEWREVALFVFEGDLVCRFELFDEADLDAALARFDELDRPASLLDNAATRIWARVADAFNRRHLEDFLALSTANLRYEDRRKGLRDEFEGSSAQRRAVLAMFEASPSSVQMTAEPIAIRGSRLSLNHVCYRDTEYDDRPITVEMLQIVEVGESGLLHLSVSFDPDDIDAAFEELDSRYLAGEAAVHARTWSVIAGTYARFNQHELPAMTTDSVLVDHRRLVTGAVDLAAFLRATWELMPDVNISIEAVHQLSDVGTVLTHAAYGTSPEGFDAEWQLVLLLTVEGDLIGRCEIFDEEDIDDALARFDELDRPASA
jgi:hypothetical protein